MLLQSVCLSAGMTDFLSCTVQGTENTRRNNCIKNANVNKQVWKKCSDYLFYLLNPEYTMLHNSKCRSENVLKVPKVKNKKLSLSAFTVLY